LWDIQNGNSVIPTGLRFQLRVLRNNRHQVETSGKPSHKNDTAVSNLIKKQGFARKNAEK